LHSDHPQHFHLLAPDQNSFRRSRGNAAELWEPGEVWADPVEGPVRPRARDVTFPRARVSAKPARMSLAPLSSGEGKAGGLVVEQGLKDGIGEAALEYAKCLASAVPTALAPFDHLFGRRMPTGLGECDAV